MEHTFQVELPKTERVLEMPDGGRSVINDAALRHVAEVGGDLKSELASQLNWVAVNLLEARESP
jgi:hypothetical protein